MNKSQKIVISIVSVVLILLIMFGLTYAYFLTQIKGNTNEKSISVTTADLKLEYGDGNGFVTLYNVVPNTTITPLVTKTFTVSNKGNVTVDYGVFLEDVINTFERVEDLDLKVECTSSMDNKTCNGYDDKMLINNDMLFSNSIDENEIQTYTLTLDYKEKDVDQSVDMNKNVSAKVQIYGLNDTIDISGEVTDAESGDYVVVNSEPKKSKIIEGKYKVVGLTPGTHTISVYDNSDTLRYSKEIIIQKGANEGINGNTVIVVNDTRLVITKISQNEVDIDDLIKVDTLYYSIINTAMLNKNGTLFRYTPLTDISQSPLENERELTITEDDYGKSYYYRGNVTDNYINFAGMCWRVVRIEGDGSIKLVLEDKDTLCNDSEANDINNDGIYYTGNWSIGNGNFGYDTYDENSLNYDSVTNEHKIYSMNYLNGSTKNDKSMAYAFKNFQISKLTNYLNYLKSGDWCMNDISYYYDANTDRYYESEEELLYRKVSENWYSYANFVNNINGLTLLCPSNKRMSKFGDNETAMYVSALSGEESAYVGCKWGVSNTFLINDWHLTNRIVYWTLSLVDYAHYSYGEFIGDGYDDARVVDYDGSFRTAGALAHANFRPAIQLKSGIRISSGVGTKANPYVIN